MDGISDFLLSFAAGGMAPAAAVVYLAWRFDRRLFEIELWVRTHDSLCPLDDGKRGKG